MRHLAIAAALVVLPACIFNMQTGNGELETEFRDVSAYQGVVNNGSLDVRMTSGAQEQSLSITCDSNLLEFVRTEVQDGTLVIGIDNGVSISTRLDCAIEIDVADLDSVTNSGSGDVFMRGTWNELTMLHNAGSGDARVQTINADMFQVDQTGSGDMNIDALTAETLVISQTASGELDVTGACDELSLSVAGSGEVDGADLAANEAFVGVSGSGDVAITVFDTLVAEVSGSGDLAVLGNPDNRDLSVSGSGDIAFE